MQNTIMADIDTLISGPPSREKSLLRDYLAHVAITGAIPTHLRRQATQQLTAATRVVKNARALDGSAAVLAVDEVIGARLGLSAHPMVDKTRGFVGSGFRLARSRGPNARRPYGKVFLERGDEKIAVKIDGSVLDHWG